MALGATKTIKGVEYELFSVEGGHVGGISKQAARVMLSEAGIKFTFTGASDYPAYVGHWNIWIELAKSDEASEILF